MGLSMRFQSSTSRMVGAGAMAFGLIGLLSMVAGRAWHDLLTYGGPLGLVALAGYAAMWAPYVEIDDGGVTLRNVFRTTQLPWPAIKDVEGRYGLRLETADGRFTAWGAPAPAGRERMVNADSECATFVRGQLERFVGLGYLDNPRLESDHPDIVLHREVVVAAVSLLAISVFGPLVG